MAFHDVQFPTNISRNARGGPRRKTQIVALSGGSEERNASWAASRRAYDIAYGIRRADDLAAVVAFFEARNGQLYGFRFKDWADYKSCLPSATPDGDDMEFALCDGIATQFLLNKTYSSGGFDFVRDITKPVDDTVLVNWSVPTGAELVVDWDNLQTTNWGTVAGSGSASGATYGSFTHAYSLNSNARRRGNPFIAMTLGEIYHCRVWLQLGTGTAATVRVDANDISVPYHTRIDGAPASPGIILNGNPVTNLVSTSLGGGVYLWEFDITPAQTRSDWQIQAGSVGTGSVIIFAISVISTNAIHGPATNWTCDPTTGIVTFDFPPPWNTRLFAGFEFDVPVRFDSDMIDVTLDFERLGTIQSIPLIEVRE